MTANDTMADRDNEVIIPTRIVIDDASPTVLLIRVRPNAAKCKANGNTSARLVPNSIGWRAVPCARVKPSRSRPDSNRPASRKSRQSYVLGESRAQALAEAEPAKRTEQRAADEQGGDEPTSVVRCAQCPKRSLRHRTARSG